MKYRIGWPGWKIAYKLGFSLYYRYVVYFNKDLKHFCGYSPDVKGVIAESEDLREVIEAIQDSANEFIAIDLNTTKNLNIKPLGALKGKIA
ncbi:Uncharacterised protein [Anaerobiospirillum thomasii]|uniref:hypothetical protein n=1 Tax=Anaerobiospirillum thomasii TaxID=179995 RepID=UPI000D9DC529|nr:hypothetical protein [Anaerobiospirillum thomasii]SPT71300.1 Uncharacterised protein [Anaerobiospirillum thomasii]